MAQRYILTAECLAEEAKLLEAEQAQLEASIANGVAKLATRRAAKLAEEAKAKAAADKKAASIAKRAATTASNRAAKEARAAAAPLQSRPTRSNKRGAPESVDTRDRSASVAYTDASYSSTEPHEAATPPPQVQAQPTKKRKTKSKQ